LKRNKKLVIVILIILIAIAGLFMFKYSEKSRYNNQVKNEENNEIIAVNEAISENVIEDKIENSEEEKNKEENNKDGNNVKKNDNTEESIVDNTNEENIENKTKGENNKEKNNKKVIVIDPGHQRRGDNSKEPIGPGATEQKAKVTTGATGVSTGQTEAELNLKVGLLLQKELESRGYSVIMTRTTNDVNISNSQRAEIANNADADVFVRIHADSVDTSSVVRNVNIMPNS